MFLPGHNARAPMQPYFTPGQFSLPPFAVGSLARRRRKPAVGCRMMKPHSEFLPHSFQASAKFLKGTLSLTHEEAAVLGQSFPAKGESS